MTVLTCSGRTLGLELPRVQGWVASSKVRALFFKEKASLTLAEP